MEWFRASTEDNKKNLDPAFYASLRLVYTGKFAAQELEGEFVDVGQGRVYEDFDEHNITEDADYDPERGPVELAYDDGFTNPRVFLLIQHTEDAIYIFDEQYHRGHLPEQCVQEVVEKVKRYTGGALPEIAIGDPSAVELKHRLRLANVPARTPKKCPIVDGILLVRRFIRDGEGKRRLFVHPRCKGLIEEMHEYHYPEAQRHDALDVPVKENDHGLDALRYWVWMRKRRG